MNPLTIALIFCLLTTGRGLRQMPGTIIKSLEGAVTVSQSGMIASPVLLGIGAKLLATKIFRGQNC